MKRYFILLTLALLTGRVAIAQGLSEAMKTAMDQLIDKRYKADEPGGTVLIARNGKVLYQRSFGMAKLEQPAPMQPDMIFNIGSQTKQFTAVCVLQLAEQGKLKVTDPISKDIDHCTPAWKDITIENLMTHSSGIGDLRNGNGLSMAARIDTAMTRPLAYKPGTKTFYANIEFDILGYIVQKISGESMAANFRKRFIGPLGLYHTYAPDSGQRVPGLISCYIKSRDGSFFNNNPTLSAAPVTGAGGLFSNTSDMAAWYEALANGKVIKKETLTRAWTPFILSDGQTAKYGYGWDAGGSVQGSAIAEHGGLAGGFVTESLYLIKEHIYVGVFLNQRGYADATAQEISAILLGKPYPAESVDSTSESDIQLCAGTYKDDSGAEKVFNFTNGKLYYEPKGARRSRLAAYGKDKFFLDDTLVECEPLRDSSGKVTAMRFHDRRYPNQPDWIWKKSS